MKRQRRNELRVGSDCTLTTCVNTSPVLSEFTMSAGEKVSLRASSSRTHSNVNDSPSPGGSDKRAVPEGLRQFLAWDAELTANVTSFLEQCFPDITKSETKFMEVIKAKFFISLCVTNLNNRFRVAVSSGCQLVCSCTSCPS